MIKAYRYRIYPTKRQQAVLNAQLAICCELYNAALQERRDAWKRERKNITWFDQNYQLKDIRRERPDVGAVNAVALEAVLRRVDLAFKAFFARTRDGAKPGYPRFRSAHRYNSITFRQIGNALCGTRLRLSKIGNLRIKLHRPLSGDIKTLNVKREAGQWFAVFVCEVKSEPLAYCANAIGVDVGLSSLATLSDGTTIENPRWYRKSESQLRVAQRRIARRKRGSSRRRKAVQLLARVHARIRNQRFDFLHNISTRLIRENGLIAVEDLNIKGLARTRLAKSIHDAAWSNFMFMLTYKAESAGRVLVTVDPRGTSQICVCGAEVRKTLAQRWHLCLNCGLSADRDHVSAQIILARGEPSGANVDAVMSCVA